jgi:hypothetical protein
MPVNASLAAALGCAAGRGRCRCGRAESGDPVPSQMWPGRAQSRRGCGRGGPSPVPDVAGGEPSRVPGTRANPNPAARAGLRLCVLVAPQRLFLPQLVELGEPDGHADRHAELPLPAWIAPVDVVRAGESRCRCSVPGCCRRGASASDGHGWSMERWSVLSCRRRASSHCRSSSAH